MENFPFATASYDDASWDVVPWPAVPEVGLGCPPEQTMSEAARTAEKSAGKRVFFMVSPIGGTALGLISTDVHRLPCFLIVAQRHGDAWIWR